MRFKTKDGIVGPLQEMNHYKPRIHTALKTSMRMSEHEGFPSYAPLNGREYVERNRTPAIIFEYEEV